MAAATPTPANTKATEAAKRWLEEKAVKGKALVMGKPWDDEPFDFLCFPDIVVRLAGAGVVICSFRVPAHLADIDGNWQPGAIATLIDDVGSAAISTAVGVFKISVDFSITFFSPAKINDEVEIEARLLWNKGKRLSMVLVEVRKAENGEMVAVGRQWMLTSGSRITPRSTL